MTRLSSTLDGSTTIQCADRCIGLAPLRIFRDALDALKTYDQYPTERNRELLKQAYRVLKKTPDEFGYSPVGQIYRGLRNILYWSLYKPDHIPSCVTQPFREAKYLAAMSVWKTMSHDWAWDPTTVLHTEDAEQSKISDQLLTKFWEEFKNSDKEYLLSKQAA